MSEKNNSRRNFLKLVGLSAGAVVSSNVMAAFVNHDEIKKLSPIQQEFMVRYGHWMDELRLVADKQKTHPEDLENQKKMMVLSDEALDMKPELSNHLTDATFAIIFKESLKRFHNGL